jgi:hypothetical protein
VPLEVSTAGWSSLATAVSADTNKSNFRLDTVSSNAPFPLTRTIETMFRPACNGSCAEQASMAATPAWRAARIDC